MLEWFWQEKKLYKCQFKKQNRSKQLFWQVNFFKVPVIKKNRLIFNLNEDIWYYSTYAVVHTLYMY